MKHLRMRPTDGPTEKSFKESSKQKKKEKKLRRKRKLNFGAREMQKKNFLKSVNGAEVIPICYYLKLQRAAEDPQKTSKFHSNR